MTTPLWFWEDEDNSVIYYQSGDFLPAPWTRITFHEGKLLQRIEVESLKVGESIAVAGSITLD